MDREKKAASFEVLIAAVEQDPEELIRRMRIVSDAVVVVQRPFGQNERQEKMKGPGAPEDTLVRAAAPGAGTVKVITQYAKGVGLSRNTALEAATADICLFGDEDIIYDDGYETKVLDAFARHPDASVLAFNVRVDERRRTYWNESEHRIRFYNYGRYPAYAVAVRRTDILNNNIRYSELFGGGEKYSNGEDSLFLHDCLKAHLKLYAVCDILGEETYRESTWFHGYTDKFFFDRGVLYHFLYGGAAAAMGARFLFSHRSTMLAEKSFREAFKLLCNGIREGRSL